MIIKYISIVAALNYLSLIPATRQNGEYLWPDQ